MMHDFRLTIIISLSLFLITLQSFYFPVFGAVLTLIGAVLIIFLPLIFRESMRLGVSDKLLVVYAGFCALLVGFTIIPRLFLGFGEKDVTSILATIIMISMFPLFYDSLKLNIDSTVRALGLVVLFHVAILFIQVGFWAVKREYLDVLNIIIGMESGSVSAKGLMIFGQRVPRFSGLFNEPGTYSVIIMSMAIVYYKLKGKIDVVVFSSSASCLATMSTFGLVLVVLLIGVVLLTGNRNRIGVFITFAALACIFYFVGGYEAIYNRFFDGAEYSGVGFRKQMLGYFFGDLWNFLFGVSLHSLPEFYVMNDIGLWFAFVTAYGFSGFLILLATLGLVYIKERKAQSVALVMIILLAKIKFTYPFFWVLLALVLVSRDCNRES